MIWWKCSHNVTLSCPNSPLFLALHLLASPFQSSNPLNWICTSSRDHNLSQTTPKSTGLSLTPQTVLNTLHNSPSDLTALRFFLWCARQRNYFHDKPTFSHMVSVLSNLTQRYGTVRGIVHELEAMGCAQKAQTLLLLMRIYWRGNMHDMVLESFQEMCNYGYVPNTYVRNIVMDVLFKVNHVEAALSVLEKIQVPNFLSFNIAICNLCRLNDVDNVKIMLRRMLMSGYYMNPGTYDLVLNCLCKSARLDEAMQLLGVMIVLGAPISVNAWTIFINGFCKSGKIEFAACSLEKMVKMGCCPNIVTFTSLIKGFLECRMPGKAFEILSTLESKGCVPDLVLYNVLIDCLSKMGWYEDAFEIFSRLRELKLTPDVYTFSSLVSTVCLSGQYVYLPLIISGLAIQPDLVVCNCLLSYFCKAGYPSGAVEFYKDMLDRGFLPDKYSFAGLLSALCQLGRMHEAVNVYRGIMRSSASVDAHLHTIVIDGLIKSGHFHQAMGLFRVAATEKFPLDVVSYTVAIDGLIRDCQMEKACTLFNQMIEVDLAPNGKIYNLMLSGFCKFGNVNMIKHVVQEMVHRNIEIDHQTYQSMNDLLCSSSNGHVVYSLLLELRNLGLLPKDGQLILDSGHDHSAYANFCSSSVSGYALDFHASSSDDLTDSVASVG